MNCSECRQSFSDFVDGDLDTGTKSKIDVHMTTCGSCKIDYEKYKISLEALRSAPVMEASAHFTDVVVREATSQIERRALFAASGPIEPSTDETLPTPKPEAAPLTFPARGESRVSPWASAAAAAAVLLAGVLIYQQIRHSRTMDQLDRGMENLRTQLANSQATLAKPDHVLINGQWVPTDKFIEEHLSARGFVMRGGKLWPKDFYDHMQQGMIFLDGSWYSTEEAARKIGLDPSLTSQEVERRLERHLTQQGYTKVDGLWLRGDDVENYSEGRVQTSPGVWMSRKDVEARLMGEAGYVLHEGKYYPKEYVAQLGSDTILASSKLPRDAHPIVAHLSKCRLGAAMRYGDLTLYPIQGPSSPHAGVTLLSGRTGVAGLTIRDDGAPFSVRVTNASGKTVALLPGDVLVGGAYDRVVAVGAVIPDRGEAVSVPVFSVESKAYRTETIFAGESGQLMAPPLVRRALASELRQAAVWASCDEYVRLTPSDAGMSLARVFEDSRLDDERRETLDELFYFPNDDATVGMAVAIGEAVIYAEWFGDHDLFLESFNRMLASAVLEAARLRERGVWDSAVPNSAAGARQFLAQVADMGIVSTGLRDSVDLRSGGVRLGSALTRDETLVHAVVFDGSFRAVERAVTFNRYPVAKGQINKVKAAIAERLQTGAAREDRRRAMRELASIPGPEAVDECRNFIRDEDHDIHSIALEKVAKEDPDARTVDALVSLFEEVLAKKNYEYLEHAAAAVALTGHKKAVDTLVDALALRDMEALEAIVPSVPKALHQHGKKDPVGRAVDRLLALYEAGSTGKVGTGAKDALERITGMTIEAPSDVAVWWNRPADREYFIEKWPRGGVPAKRDDR